MTAFSLSISSTILLPPTLVLFHLIYRMPLMAELIVSRMSSCSVDLLCCGLGSNSLESQRCPARGLNQIWELLCFRYHRCCLNASSITFYLMFFDFPGSIAKHILATLNPWSLTLRLSGTITHEHHCA